MNAYNRARAYGRPTSDLTDAAPVQEWIQRLREAGLTPAIIAHAAGVHRSTVRKIIAGGASVRRNAHVPFRIHRATAARILNVGTDLSCAPDETLVDARGTQRRLQALAARGWSLAELARRLGAGRTLDKVHRQRWVTSKLHREVSELYEQLWDQQPPTTTSGERAARSMALNRARAEGWLPPLAWDDIDTDPAPAPVDTAPVVDEVAVALALQGEPVRLTAAERAMVVDEGTRLGMSLRDLAERVQATDRHVHRLRCATREAA